MTAAKPAVPGLEERVRDVRAVLVRYFVGGDGPPLVLVHGLGGAASNWIELASALAPRHRLLVPELPGHGGSAPLPAAPNLNGYADRVAELVRREGMAPAVVVGHSTGGLVALRVSLRHPDAVRGVVLAGSAGISSATRWAQFWIAVSGITKPGRRLAPFRETIARRPLLRYAAFAYWGASDPPAMPARGVEGLLAGPALHTDTVSAGAALVRDDPRVDLAGVRCPVLVLWGARDRQVPVADGFEYARRLRAPLRTIADCGHLLIVERPDACAHAIEEFAAGLG